MFINEDEKDKRIFGHVVGNTNIKESAGKQNYKHKTFGELFSIRNKLLNIKIMLSYQGLVFTKYYEQMLRKSKILLRFKGLDYPYPVNKM